MEQTFMPFDDDSPIGKLLHSLGPFGVLCVDPDRVNLDDLVADSRPGKIVRVYGNPDECIKFIAPADVETLGCVAGWISDGG